MAYHHGNLRAALLERAAQVIAESGIEALSLRALARDLDVSHAAPRRHFANRTALLAALAREGFARSLAAMKAGAERAGPDAVAAYRALGRSYVQFAIDHQSYFRAINHPEVLANSDASLRAARRAWIATLREGVEAAKAAGWHPDTDTDTLLAFSCAAAMGAATLLSDSGWRQRELFGHIDAEALADAVLDLTVHRSPTLAHPARSAPRKPARRRRPA